MGRADDEALLSMMCSLDTRAIADIHGNSAASATTTTTTTATTTESPQQCEEEDSSHTAGQLPRQSHSGSKRRATMDRNHSRAAAAAQRSLRDMVEQHETRGKERGQVPEADWAGDDGGGGHTMNAALQQLDQPQAQPHLAAMEYLHQMLQKHQQQQQQQLLLLQKHHELLLQQCEHQESSSVASGDERLPATTGAGGGGDLLSPRATATFYQQLAQLAAVAAGASVAAADEGPSGCGTAICTASRKITASPPVQITSIDGFFNRKRGRPPKNRFVEVYKNTQHKPQAIFTSFKLEKHGLGASAMLLDHAPSHPVESATEVTSMEHHNLASQQTRPAQMESRILSPPECSSSATIWQFIEQQSHFEAPDAAPQFKPNQSFQKCAQPFLRQQERKVSPCGNVSGVASVDAKRPKYEREMSADSKGERVSVVRAAGTFYPENCNSTGPAANERVGAAAAEEPTIQGRHKRNVTAIERFVAKAKRMRVEHREEQPGSSATTLCEEALEMPQDLSINTKPKGTALDRDNERELDCAKERAREQQERLGYRFQQLLSFYQQHQQQQQQQHQHQLLPFMDLALLQSGAPPSTAEGQARTTICPKTPAALFLERAGILETAATFLESFATSAASAAHTAAAESIAPAALPRVPPLAVQSAPTECDRSGSLGLLNKPNDDRIPLGYLKFRFNEDCGFPRCGYRNHQSHFHCNRVDCHYSFCDKTRFVQHTARHERLDMLMGEDFLQYRANISCGHNNCPYQKQERDGAQTASSAMAKKSSHFHCRKCEFICSDTNKVVAHRRLHGKMEYIRKAGFRKVASNESCVEAGAKGNETGNGIAESAEVCPYSLKHTHYHCLVCDASVLSRAQLTTHKHKPTASATMLTALAASGSL